MLYRKIFNRQIYYVNIETGEKKTKLEAGDILVGDSTKTVQSVKYFN